MLFHPLSLEQTVAVLVVGILPIALAYVAAVFKWQGESRFDDVLRIAFAYLVVFVRLAVLHFNFDRVQRGGASYVDATGLAIQIVVFGFPALLLSIASLILTLLVWESRSARYAFVAITVLVQILYFVNLAIVASGGEVISI